MAKLCIIIAILLIPHHFTYAQAGKNLPLWSDCWTEEKEIHKSVVVISCRLDSITTAGGSGCLLEGRDVITAAHVVDGGYEFSVTFHDGVKIKAKMKTFNTAKDFAVLELLSDPPANAVHSKISQSDITAGDSVEVCGFSGGEGLRHFSAKVLGTDEDRVVISGYVGQGDSGGPIFNSNGEIISVVSGGCLWIKNQTANGKDGGPKVTAPILGPALKNHR